MIIKLTMNENELIIRPQPKSGIGNIAAHMSSPSVKPPPVSIKLDANESVLGASPHAIEAATAEMARINRYLENQDRILSSAIERRFGLDRSRIVVGQGSDDLLARLARAFLNPGDELVRSANSYLKVPNYAYANNAVPISAPDQDFTAQVDSLLNAVSTKTRIVYLANPDNPSGTAITSGELRRLHAGLNPSVLLIVDCAYAEYAENGHNGKDALNLVEQFENVVVTRTFSKAYGLAGARVGWLYGAEHVADSVRRIGLTFPISTPSIAAALAALDDQNHIDFVRSETLRLRDQFSGALTRMGLKVYSSQTNFVLADFSPTGRSAVEAALDLRRRGIAVRRMASPSYRNCIRITLGFENELQTIETALADFLESDE